MKKILVTGGAGYIGSHTVVELVKAGYDPVILDDFSNSEPWIIDSINSLTQKEIAVYDVDCTNEIEVDKVFLKEKFDGVIHFAAFKAVGESVNFPDKYYKNNVGSLLVIVAAMKKYNVKNIVFSSSCTVYGQPEILPVTEESPVLSAESPYGYTKQVCEQLLQDIKKSNNSSITSVLLRYFNPIGAHESGVIGELPLGVPNNLVPYISKVAAGELDQLTVFGSDYNTPDGTCIRDYIHVVDLAIAHVKSIEWLVKQDQKTCEIFNIGIGKGATVLECVQTFQEINDVDVQYQLGERREGDIEQIYADNKKALSQLGWEPTLTMGDAFKAVWKWQKYLKSESL